MSGAGRRAQRWIPLVAIALVISSLAVVFSTHQVRTEYARLQTLELQRWQLQEDYTRLLLEMNTWAAPHRIGRLASEELMMHPPSLVRARVVSE